MTKRLAVVLAWALVVCAVLVHNVYLFAGRHVEPDTDILALLPAQERDPVLGKAFARMVDAAQQRIVVLVGARDWNEAVRAADAYSEVVKQHPDLLQASASLTDGTQGEWLDTFRRQRRALLTPQQHKALQEQPAEHWVDVALSRLYSPFGGPNMVPWQEDPFNLFGGWAQARMQETPVRPRDGRLHVSDGERDFVVIPLSLKTPAFSMNTQQDAMPVLQQAKDAAFKTASGAEAGVEVISAGMMLHAAAASERASWEVSIIGTGSMIGILLLIWVTFRSFKPILLVTLSLVVGTLGAMSVCSLFFDRIHVLTLVFGASLLGVAQDYSIYFICNRISADPELDSWQLLRKLFPGMFLTFVTTVIAYMGLALTPFPGLQQMAVFSTFGLIFAWLTVIFWFPFLVSAKTLSKGTLGQWYKRSVDYWPTARLNRKTLIVLVLFVVFCAFGLARLGVNDDIRLLQSPNADLIAEQGKIGKLLDMPAPAQFFLVRGESAEALLQREEALRHRLDELVGEHVISGYQAMSNWVPSQRSQQAARTLVEQKLLAEHGPLDMLAGRIGEGGAWSAKMRADLLPHSSALTVEQFLASPASEASRHLWLGNANGVYGSMVAVRGLSTANMAALKNVPDGLEGVQWVDKVGEISSVLGNYRQYMGWVVLVSFVAVYLLVYPRYRKASWRVMLPTVLASVATLAILGIAGQNLQLFNMLALMLILGIGVDYGIFMYENASQNMHSVWLEIGISALSTLLSFGLLGLSATPALQSFGLTMLVGLILVWLCVPCFSRKPADDSVAAIDERKAA